jgi:hypothetical protein
MPTTTPVMPTTIPPVMPTKVGIHDLPSGCKQSRGWLTVTLASRSFQHAA